METTFALKKAIDKITNRVHEIVEMNDWADKIYAQNEHELQQRTQEKRNGKSEFNFNRLMDLFRILPPSQLDLEVIALANLLDNVLADNSVLPILINEKSKPAPEDDDYAIYQLVKFLSGIRSLCTEATKPYFTEYLKRFRYKPEFLSEIKHIIPEDDFNSIVNTYEFDFVKYATEIYKYYYEFYSLGVNLDSNLLCELASLRDYDKVNKFINKKQSFNEKAYKFEFEINTSKPTEHIKEELDIFRNDLAMFIMDSHNEKVNLSQAPYHILNDYIRDDIGKVRNFNKLFPVWKRILKVYYLRKEQEEKNKLSWEKIRRETRIPDPKDDYDRAKAYINSALNGTFPLI